MPLQWKIEEHVDHVLVLVEGQWHVPSLKNMIDEIARTCSEDGQGRVLCDMRGMGGLAAETDKFVIGVHLAERLPGTRFAAVINRDLVINRFTENVANRRGARLMATHDMEEARRWLFSAD